MTGTSLGSRRWEQSPCKDRTSRRRLQSQHTSASSQAEHHEAHLDNLTGPVWRGRFAATATSGMDGRFLQSATTMREDFRRELNCSLEVIKTRLVDILEAIWDGYVWRL